MKHKAIVGQVDIFEIHGVTATNYPKEIANCLIYHCIYWNYDYITKFNSGNKTPENFLKTFCRITKTEFFHIKGDTYNITFNKKELNATVKRCGKDYDKRDFDAIITIEDIIRELPSTEEYERRRKGITRDEAYALHYGESEQIIKFQGGYRNE